MTEKNLTELRVKTDVQYVRDVVHQFIKSWSKNGFKKKDGSDVKHKVYMEELSQLMQMIEVSFR